MNVYMIALLTFDICGAAIDFSIYKKDGNKVMLIPTVLFAVAAAFCLFDLIAQKEEKT